MKVEIELELLRRIYAQLCGVRMEKGRTEYYSALDDSIDRVRAAIESYSIEVD